MELVHGSFGPAIAHSIFSLMAQKSYLALSGLDFKWCASWLDLTLATFLAGLLMFVRLLNEKEIK
jgi:hypothetical protein